MTANTKRFFSLVLLLSSLYLCGSGQPVYAREQVPPDTTGMAASIPIPYDSAAVAVRAFDAAQLKALREQKEFQYELEYSPEMSLWDKFWYHVRQLLRKVFLNEGTGRFWEYTLYALAIGIAVYAVLQLLKIEMTGLFGRRASSDMQVPYDTYQENIHEMDFDGMIEEAIQQKDYRRAIRLYYLHSLKVLTDRELIDWSPSKTNRSYLSEIRQQEIRNEFEQVTGLFEYVWYGGVMLSDEKFESTRKTFAHFMTLIAARA